MVETKIAGIYCWLSALTQEVLYVGRSIDVVARKKQHIYALAANRHSSKEFNHWYNQHAKNLSFKILEECSLDDLSSRELFWFNELKPIFYGMKPTVNSQNHSYASRLKISEGQKLPKAFIDDEEFRKIYLQEDSTLSSTALKLGIKYADAREKQKSSIYLNLVVNLIR